MKNTILVICALLATTCCVLAQSSGPGPFTLNAPAGSSNIQWYNNGAVIPGETGNTFSASSAGIYWAEYDEVATSCMDAVTEIHVVVVQGSTQQTTLEGPTGQSSYQWHKDGSAIVGETNANLVLANAASAIGTYYLSYFNGSCTVQTRDYVVYNLVVPCNAGTANPVLSATTLSNVCPATTADLTSITPSNAPSGTNLTWHTSTPASGANTVPDPMMVGAGTYYAAFHDVANNCYSGPNGDGSATTEVTVTILDCCVGFPVPTLTKN